MAESIHAAGEEKGTERKGDKGVLKGNDTDGPLPWLSLGGDVRLEKTMPDAGLLRPVPRFVADHQCSDPALKGLATIGRRYATAG
jgi:hypothetical protein